MSKRFSPVPQGDAGMSRRQLLKSAGIVSGLVAVAGAVELTSAVQASAATQDLWGFCSYCRCMYYGYTASRGYGTCSATGGAHDHTTDSYNYHFSTTGGGQSGWRWCNKCCVMFYAGSGTTGGVCAYDGSHHTASSTSYNYHVYYEPYTGSAPLYQSGWHWCTSCAALVWNTNGSYYVECQATGHYHTRGSRIYDGELPLDGPTHIPGRGA